LFNGLVGLLVDWIIKKGGGKMSKIERFEDLKVWQAARVLVNQVYDVSEQGRFARDFGLRDQIREAAGSTMHNPAEGFEAGSNAEFIRFLKYARRSASEVQSELYIALDRRYLTPEQFQTIYEQATQLKKLINGLITYLRQAPLKPNK
jgi:four helix bundle protein